MLSLKDCRRLADDIAQSNGDVITDPAGLRDDEILFYAQPADLEDAELPDGFAAIGLPYGYWVNVKTGATRICTGKESDLLTDRKYLAGFEPIPE